LLRKGSGCRITCESQFMSLFPNLQVSKILHRSSPLQAECRMLTAESFLSERQMMSLS
jgi:hypothetical protein